MNRYLPVHVLTAGLLLGVVFSWPGILRAEPRDSVQEMPQGERSVSSDPFAPSPDIADLIRRNQKPAKVPKSAPPVQVTSEGPTIKSPPGWLMERDTEEEMTIYYPPNLPDDQMVELAVFDKMSSNSRDFSRRSSVALHDDVMSKAVDICIRAKGSPQKRTLSRPVGSTVHSSFVCLRPDGRRIAQSIYTIKTSTSVQLVMLRSDEQIHERYLPTVKAMLQPALDEIASVDHGNVSADDGTDRSVEAVTLYAKSGVSPLVQLFTVPETAASVDLLKVLQDSEIGKGFLDSMQDTTGEREKHIAQLKQRIATRKEQAASAAGDRKKSATLQQQIAADEGALLTAETEFNAHITKTVLDPFKAKVRIVATKLAQEFGLAAVVEVGASMKAVLSPKVTDLTDLTIANMTVASLEKGAPIVRVVPEKKPASPQAAQPEPSTELSRAEIDRRLYEMDQHHQRMMSIIQSMNPRRCNYGWYCY